MSLVTDLGNSYFNDRFSESMFLHPELGPCYIRDAYSSSGKVGIVSVKGNVGKLNCTNHEIDHSFFTSMEQFAIPELGWRGAANGKYLAFFSRNNRSYHRATSASVLTHEIHAVTNMLHYRGKLNMDYYHRNDVITKLILDPEYTSFSEGIEKLKSGTHISFPVSARIAVVAETDDSAAIYFNQNRVGDVDYENNRINCKIPVIVNKLQEEA